MLFLVLIGVIAGMVEASSGGSGLISLPAIMLFGYQPIEAIATSKFQYAFGASTAIYRYSKAGIISWANIAPMVLGAAVAGAIGAWSLSFISSKYLSLLVPFILMALALYFLFSPAISDAGSRPRLSYKTFGFAIVPLIALYDGFLGVGSASMYMSAFVFMLGMNVRSATANTKLVDFASGVSALIVLALQGHVLIVTGLLLAIGQVIGSYIGAGLVLKLGAKWIRPLIVLVTFLLSIDLLWRHYNDLIQLILF